MVPATYIFWGGAGTMTVSADELSAALVGGAAWLVGARHVPDHRSILGMAVVALSGVTSALKSRAPRLRLPFRSFAAAPALRPLTSTPVSAEK
jgi:hypothetical protein